LFPNGSSFFFGDVTATAPSRDLTDNKKKEEGGLKQRRKQEEAAQGDPEPGKGFSFLYPSLWIYLWLAKGDQSASGLRSYPLL